MEETRTIKLTDTQISEIRKASLQRAAIDNAMTALVKSLIQQAAEHEEAFWDQLHAITGTTVESHHLKIRMISGDLVITPRTQNDDDE